MGRRGPKRTPDAVLKQRGSRSRRKSREPQGERIKVKIGTPSLPADLMKDKDAIECWEITRKSLIAMKVITPNDRMVFEGLCRAYSRARQADRLIARHGMLLQTEFGLKANPAVGMAKSAWAEVRKFAAEFGMSPASRESVRVAPSGGSGVSGESKNGKKEVSTEEMLFGTGTGGKIVGRIGR